MSEPATLSYSIRHPVEDEIDAIVDLMNACAIDEIGVPDAEAGEVLRTWKKASFDRERDSWVAENGDGRLVGYAFVEFETEGGDLLIDAYTDPMSKGVGIGSTLSELAERRATQLAVEHGKETPVEVFRGAFTGTEGAEFLEARGYELTRCFIRMRIDMDGAAGTARMARGNHGRPGSSADATSTCSTRAWTRRSRITGGGPRCRSRSGCTG